MTELNKIIKKYSTLLGVMEQLEKEAPVIEETYKELQSIINKQSTTEKDALEKIKIQANSSIEEAGKIELATQELTKQYEKFEKLIKSSKKQQDEFLKKADEKIAELKNLSSNNSPTFDVAEIYSRLSRVETKVSAFDRQGRSISTNDKHETTTIEKTRTSTYSTSKNSFPADAKRFTFDNVKKVSGKKPYGIVIEGNIIKVRYWTNMLDAVIPYVFDKYDGDVDELCDNNYGITLPGKDDKSERFIPYFIKGMHTQSDSQTYRPISKLGLSVRYCGATETVEELKLLLCDYFLIDEKDVELFYHDN